MLCLLSPAKNIDENAKRPEGAPAQTEPVFLKDAVTLAGVMRGFDDADISALMGVSANIAALNTARYRDFPMKDYRPCALPPAACAFNGDVYKFFKAGAFNAEEAAHAQKGVRILSGLYGLLRPYDGMYPYRLEMGTKLKTDAGANLYAYWGERLARQLDEDAEQSGGERILLNLASVEYFTAVERGKPRTPVIHAEFKEIRDGKIRVIALNAKRARGMMAAYVIRNAITSLNGVRGFDEGGYAYRDDLSQENRLVFVR